MPYIPPEVVEKAREMDLLTYLKNYEPHELVHFGGSTYCTREHDSLKISNGKWCWFSRGIGGKTALDYLINLLFYLECVNKCSLDVEGLYDQFVGRIKLFKAAKSIWLIA